MPGQGGEQSGTVSVRLCYEVMLPTVTPSQRGTRPPHSAASAAFSVALGRIAADVFAGSGR